MDPDDLDMDVLLPAKEATAYRRAAARINYMTLDRIDLAFASKETARGMAVPKNGDVVNLKRTLRYLKGTPDFAFYFEFQDFPNIVQGYSDSDWAGCKRTRRSTSGGVLMLGTHTVHHFSSTQATVALSSAEAELNSAVKCTSELLGLQQMMLDLNLHLKAELSIDSSAAKGLLQRRGAGRVKHLEVKQLWTQELVMNKKIKILKVPRLENPSDCLTHHWTVKDAIPHFERMRVGI